MDLGEGDARSLAKAYADVAQYYPILSLDPKIAAIINLGTTVAIIGGARVTAYRFRRMNERGVRVAQTQPAPSPSFDDMRRAASPQVAQPPMNGQVNGVDYTKNAARDVAPEVRTGEIPGLGKIEFPSDHPLVKGKPN